MELLSRDAIGLGVSLSGTVTDGITVSELHEKGPALQSGKVHVGMFIWIILLI